MQPKWHGYYSSRNLIRHSSIFVTGFPRPWNHAMDSPARESMKLAGHGFVLRTRCEGSAIHEGTVVERSETRRTEHIAWKHSVKQCCKILVPVLVKIRLCDQVTESIGLLLQRLINRARADAISSCHVQLIGQPPCSRARSAQPQPNFSHGLRRP